MYPQAYYFFPRNSGLLDLHEDASLGPNAKRRYCTGPTLTRLSRSESVWMHGAGHQEMTGTRDNEPESRFKSRKVARICFYTMDMRQVYDITCSWRRITRFDPDSASPSPLSQNAGRPARSTCRRSSSGREMSWRAAMPLAVAAALVRRPQ